MSGIDPNHATSGVPPPVQRAASGFGGIPVWPPREGPRGDADLGTSEIRAQ